jgi:hypothetical protein
VLNRSCYEVVAGVQKAEDGGVVTLGATGVENYFGVMAFKEARHGLARPVNGCASLLAVLVD